MDGQQVAAFGIVAVAAGAVGRRLWGQVAAFRGKPGRGGACDGCPSSGASAKTSGTASPLMQIQTKPPVHLRRPPSAGR
jgi:hypothetical protein